MQTPDENHSSSNDHRVGEGSKAMSLTLVPIVGSIILGLVALYWYNVGTAGFFWALACLAIGSLFGIVFGIPREAARSANTGTAQPAGLRANTNMEEISDWLTKLLVGAGLVELKSAPVRLAAFAKYVAASLPTHSQPATAIESIAASLIVYFLIEGFIGGYLLTRVFFQIAFQRSDERLDPKLRS